MPSNFLKAMQAGQKQLSRAAVGLLVAGTLAAGAAAQAAGEWNVGSYNWHAKQNGNEVWGDYDSDEGRITGALSGRTLTGYWIERKSDKKCSYQRDGSYYWGGLRWTYDANWSSFSGTWGYCDDFDRATWEGSRVGGSLPPGPLPPPEPFPINGSVAGEWNVGSYTWRAQQSGNQVWGNYDSDEGRIIGTLSGRTLTGYWIERSSDRKCSYQRDGSYYWGGLRWTYDPALNTFSGTWGYCDDLDQASWEGSRVNTSTPPPPPTPDPEPEGDIFFTVFSRVVVPPRDGPYGRYLGCIQYSYAFRFAESAVDATYMPAPFGFSRNAVGAPFVGTEGGSGTHYTASRCPASWSLTPQACEADFRRRTLASLRTNNGSCDAMFWNGVAVPLWD